MPQVQGGGEVRPYYEDEWVTLYHGDCLDVLPMLPDASVNACVTSPPYFGLRDYGDERQHGMEDSPAEYVETLRAVFAEVWRVLADDGTLWLNLGDSYYSGRGSPGPNSAFQKNAARRGWVRPVDRPAQRWGRPKGLLGIPWRVAFALMDDGWTLRNDNIWNKTNAMPESVHDRLSGRHEYVFLFTKGPRYWFDLDPIREPHLSEPGREGRNYMRGQKAVRPAGPNSGSYSEGGKNPGDVWSIPTRPFPEAHFATMTPEVAHRCIVAGCKSGGVVLDPYSGSGTTGRQATRAGRRYVGIDTNADYLDLSLRTRLAQDVLDFGSAS